MLTNQKKQILNKNIYNTTPNKLKIHTILYYIYFNKFNQIINTSKQTYIKINKSTY